jgi:hypothetical protein
MDDSHTGIIPGYNANSVRSYIIIYIRMKIKSLDDLRKIKADVSEKLS